VPKHHAQNIDFMLKHYAQNIDFMLKLKIQNSMLIIQKFEKCSYILCSKAEIFIHVAVQNLTMWYTAQDNSWTAV